MSADIQIGTGSIPATNGSYHQGETEKIHRVRIETAGDEEPRLRNAFQPAAKTMHATAAENQTVEEKVSAKDVASEAIAPSQEKDAVDLILP
ncbi:MAG: hypothetical protein LBE84_02060, partial [Planctomycetota bacterium]|nr:hypothetical protein [Planctomycetota bacterium]